MGPADEESPRRLFVAVWPPPAVAVALRDLIGDSKGPVRWVAPDDLHVTLHFVGEVRVTEVTNRLDDATLVRSTARLGPAVRRLGASALVVPVTGLDRLAADVRRALAGLDSTAAPRSFSGHVTLGRVKGPPRRNSAPPVAPDVMDAPVEHSFVVDEVVLTSSELTPDGPLYATVASWPTSAPADDPA